MKPKYSVLTYIIGNYEIVRDINWKSDKAEYILVTDNPNLKSNDWEIKYVKNEHPEDPFWLCYQIRFNPFKYINTDICLRIDGSMSIEGDTDQLIETFNKNNYDISLMVHPLRNSIPEEYDVWVNARKYPKSQKDKCLNYMRQYLDVDNYKGLFQYNFCIQRNDSTNNEINKKTLDLLIELRDNKKCIERIDQTIGTFIINKYFSNINVMLVDEEIVGPIFKWYQHGSTEINPNKQFRCKPYLFNQLIKPLRFDKRIKILVLKNSDGGCSKYRTVDPHNKMKELLGDSIYITFSYKWDRVDGYDIVHFHNGLYKEQEEFWEILKYCKERNIITVMDIDDFWELNPEHPYYEKSIEIKRPERIIHNFELVDYVTTTTQELANRIKEYNKNVVVFPNALDDSFNVKKSKSDKIRFGFVMGNTHEHDLEEFAGCTKLIPKLILNEIELVLCGYPNTKIIGYDRFGMPITQTEPYKEVWDNCEKIVKSNIPNYKRMYRRDINTYNQFYSDIDVLLAPLAFNEYNLCKSELKFIEAGFTNTAVIASDYGPYSTGPNCIRCKTKQDWANAIIELANSVELRNKLAKEMSDYVHVHNNLDIVTQQRIEWYKNIINNGI